MLPDVVLRAAPADVRDGGAVDGHAAGRAAEGEIAVVAENLVGMDLAGHGGAEGVFRNHGGVLDEMAEAALVDHVVFDFIDTAAGEVVVPDEGAFTMSLSDISVTARTVIVRSRLRTVLSDMSKHQVLSQRPIPSNPISINISLSYPIHPRIL